MTLICDDVFQFVKGLFDTGFLPESVNETHIAVVPKVQQPDTPVQFRPISLCNFT